jgi:ubiquinone/menaquinone biosynthesis methyltransferase
MRLPFIDDAFAAMTCGFGMRNLADPHAGVREAFRVLKPGGVFVVLEFFKPTRLPTRVFHACYARGILPLVGSMISGDAEAYRYLSDSMQGFLTREEFEQAFHEAGFRDVHASDLTFGIASIVWGRK